ncbi:MAG: thermonuclease family protein [Thiogranum sp.]|nr:thermonuclease family protein [Thiogranum sp.]
MNEDWRRRKRRLRLPQDSALGILVLIAIAMVAVIVIVTQKNDPEATANKPVINDVRVIDGDTIETNSATIRLFGIDAPETGQPCTRNGSSYDCGGASKEHLQFIITGATVSCDDRGKDRWGRTIGVCMADGKDIGRLMVRHGWALAYREYSSNYAKDEEFAKENRLGVWSKEFATPSDWRKSDRGDKL